ncbi:DUF998 domain-containing protein [Cryptosporangium sp. NPDC048952]|uniref:DUF998 domain-containing protein n=1 Tax=Cryptosporangium sp. NPDC048952 TaxID=3363961 RepID=UPI003714AC1E
MAGPLFVGVWAVQALTREGFEVGRHPVSLLALGEFGWVQIASFVITGALLVLAGAGLRPRWGGALIAGFGVGMVVAGVFVTDAGAGFPAGAPAGAPESTSWHGILHELGFVLASLCWTAAAIGFAVHFLRRRQWAAGAATVAVLLAVLALAAWPDTDGIPIRLVIATALQLGSVAALAAIPSMVRPGRPLVVA